MAQQKAVTGDCKVFCNRKLPSANVSGELVLMSVETNKYYGFDPIASDIWRRIGDGIQVKTLCDEVTASYEGRPDDIERDLIRLLTQMQDHGLLLVCA